MNMSLQLVMTARQELIQELGLKGEFFESVLIRTEKALKKRRAQKGLKLICSISDSTNYRGVIDLLLGLCSREWDIHMQSFYDRSGPAMRDMATPEVIDQVDRVLAGVVSELYALYRAYEAEDWKAKEDPTTSEYDEVTREGLRWFIGPHLPAPPLNFAAVRAT